MSEYYTILSKLPANPLIDSYVRPNTSDSVHYWRVALDDIKPEVIDCLVQHGVSPKEGYIFKKIPNSKGTIHSDCFYDNDSQCWEPWHCGINWNLDGAIGLMCWFSITAPKVFGDSPKSKVNRKLLNGVHYGARMNKEFTNDERFTIIDQCNISKPTLVSTSTPHQVTNVGSTLWWSLSLRFNYNPTFEECRVKLLDLQ